MWVDDFDGPEGAPPSPECWTFEVGGGGWGDEQLQTYTRENATLDGNGCLAIVARPEWHTLTTAALASDDRNERALGIEAAKRLGIPLRDHLVRSIKADFDDSWLWCHLVPGADGEPLLD